MVPIPKKDDLTSCDNWRGICLLDIVGKVVARVIQERLQKLVEDELPESQCGFRKGRSCTDMIFTVRQLIKKSWEHQPKTFFTFINLKKAYDPVPREAMWLALNKLGVPESLVELIRSFHEDTKANNKVVLEEISMQNGLRQRCCMETEMLHGDRDVAWRQGCCMETEMLHGDRDVASHQCCSICIHV